MLALLACAGAWRWIRTVFIPANTAEAHAIGRPIGNNSDLYPRWLGARELLLRHRDPYSAEISREIQVGYYGRELDPGKAGDPSDQAGFAYPVYVAFLLWPAVNAKFATVQAVSGWVLLVCAAASVPLWFRALGVQAGAAMQTAFALGMFATYPAIQAYYLRQLTLLLALALAAAVAGVRSKRLTAAGIVLALATIKPQLVAPLLVVLGIWTAGRWRQRQRLAWSFAATMIVLVGAGEAALPGWIPRFVAASRAYQRYAGDPSLLQVLLGWMGGLAVSALVLVAVFAYAWRNRRAEADAPAFVFAVAAALAADVLVLPKLAPYNEILLFPALVLLWRRREQVLAGGAAARALYRATFACLGWQWAAACVLAALSFVVPLKHLARISGAPLYTVYPLPVVLGLTLLLVAIKRRNESDTAAREAARA